MPDAEVNAVLADIGRIVARDVAAARRFDPDHFGAQAAQQQRAQRAGQRHGQIKNAYTFQRSCYCHGRLLKPCAVGGPAIEGRVGAATIIGTSAPAAQYDLGSPSLRSAMFDKTSCGETGAM